PGGAPVVLALGGRSLRYGARFTDPSLESQPDPLWHLPPTAAQSGNSLLLPGFEARNLNRVYPGDPAGSMTARTAWAITNMLRSPGIVAAIDLHEASRKSGLAYTLITRSEFMDIAVATVLDLEIQCDLTFRLERSDSSHAGYSHWEWGGMGMPSFLVETYNPTQDTAIDSKEMLALAKEHLAVRVFAQLCALDGLVRHIAETSGQMIRLEGLPSHVDDVQSWLNGSIL
ncbi:MAG: succinylglutamate desuccinylase/aspartoacylase family protein, partial [Spirochaetales bacterium]|nr:succinylglutamate desuccinylase/aspartoacylase family protein [Spirochaetales bacterium]